MRKIVKATSFIMYTDNTLKISKFKVVRYVKYSS